jgi:hypothetical protein
MVRGLACWAKRTLPFSHPQKKFCQLRKPFRRLHYRQNIYLCRPCSEWGMTAEQPPGLPALQDSHDIRESIDAVPAAHARQCVPFLPGWLLPGSHLKGNRHQQLVAEYGLGHQTCSKKFGQTQVDNSHSNIFGSRWPQSWAE